MSAGEDVGWNTFASYKEVTATQVRSLVSLILEKPPTKELLNRSQWEALTKKWSPSFRLAFEGRLLAEVVADPTMTKEITHWAATLWSSLTDPKSWRTGNLCDKFTRWHPLPGDAHERLDAADAATLVRSIRERTEASYAIPFPVVALNNDWESLITARVTRLCRPGDATDSQDDDLLRELPCIVVAPWSEYLPSSSSFENLKKTLEKIPELRNARFLLELETTLGLEPTNGVLINGNSSDLSILLAALAVDQTYSYLKPFVATGSNNHENENQPGIGSVGHVKRKWEAVLRYAKARREKIAFLIPEEDYSRIEREREHKDSFPLNTAYVTVIRFPKNLNQQHLMVSSQLTDGCDRFRDFLKKQGEIRTEESNEFAPDAIKLEDVHELNTLAHGLSATVSLGSIKDRGLSTVILPFNCEPRRAAHHVARAALEIGSKMNPTGFRRNPLILPLDDDFSRGRDSDSDIFNELASRIARGTGTTVSEGMMSVPMEHVEIDLIPQQAARNLLVHHQPRVLLILHDRRSLNVDYSPAHTDDVKRVWNFLRKEAPDVAAVLIASDWHHFEQLRHWGLAAEESKPPSQF